MSDDKSDDSDSTTVSDLGEGDGHTTEKGRFHQDGSDDSSTSSDDSDE